MPLSTGNAFLDAIGGNRWANPFVNVTFNNSGQGGAWTGAEIGAFTAAFDTWARVANVNWGFGSVPGGSNIVEFKRTSAELGTDLGRHDFPSSATHDGQFNINQSWTAAAMQRGGHTFETFVHEIGHAIGMAHPHDTAMGTGRFAGVNASGDAGNNSLNQSIFTVMSYRDPPRAPADDYGMPAGPMAFDIAAIQALYGANTMTGLGDDTYILPDANAAGTFWSCVWDMQGIDQIVYNGARRAMIDLRPATLRDEVGGGGFQSQAQGIRGGFTIAADWRNAAINSGSETGVVIENAVGGANADTLIGNGADNRFYGRGGGDSMDGRDGDDMASYIHADRMVIADLLFSGSNRGDAFGDLYDSIEQFEGSNFGDHLGGNHGHNTIWGGDGADLLAGRGGNDELAGSWFNDTMAGDSGADTLHGGGGDDLATYQASPAGLVVDLLFPQFNTWEAAGDRYDSVENLLGSFWNDTLGGTHDANTIIGWEGDDRIAGRAGGDLLTGEGGADSLLGEAGPDTLWGGAEADTLDGGSDADQLEGGTGDDTYFVNSNADRVREAAGGGHDRVFTGASFTLHLTLAEVEELRLIVPTATSGLTLIGSNTPNLIVANAGNNRLDGRDSADTMVGLGGADTYTVDNSADLVVEADEPGNDLVVAHASISLAGNFAERLTLGGSADINGAGNSTDNTILGNGGNNTLAGLAGADWIMGRGGGDTVSGGDGADTAFGDSGDDLLYGDGAADRLYGGAGADTLSGGDGDDVLRGEAGPDSLIGGNGNDMADYATAPDRVWLVLATGGILGHAAGDQFQSVERVNGSLFDDTLTGDSGANLLRGQDGADWLDSGDAGGRDTLQGGIGNDYLFVNTGDVVDGGPGYDYVNARPASAVAGWVFVATDVQAIEGIQGHNGSDRIDASARTLTITIVTHAGNDTVLGGSGDDAIQAFDGDDSLHGGAGFDQLHGGNGNDTLIGGGGADNPPWTDWLFGGEGEDSLIGSGRGFVIGEGGNDTLVGGAGELLNGGSGADSILGTTGNEQLIGGAGTDTMAGGAGNDRFDFDDGWGDDVITDFLPGADRLYLVDVEALDLFSQLVRTTEAGGARVSFAGSSILLAGLTAAQVTEADVLL